MKPLHSTDLPTMVGIGAGGHARVMIRVARRCGWNVRLLVDRPGDHPTSLDGVSVTSLDDAEFLTQHVMRNPDEPVAVFIGVTGKGTARTSAYRRLVDHQIVSPNLIDPDAIVETDVAPNCGVHILAGAIVAAGAELGCNVLINHRSVVEHDTTIEDDVHIATGAVLCGGVVVETGSMVGAGAVVLPGIRIGVGSVVGAGAVVTREVPPATIVVGNPAKPMHSATKVSVHRSNPRSIVPSPSSAR